MPEPNEIPDPPESTDFPVRPIAITAAAMLASLVVILIVLALIYQVRPSPPQPDEALAHGPRATTSIEADQAELRARFAKNLGSPHWIDREAGIVAIPVDRAIDRIAADGELPTWPSSDDIPAPRNRPDMERSSP